jgi:hypothetical protein
MPADRSTLTTSEVDAVLTVTAQSRNYRGKNKVSKLGRINTPTLNMFRGKGTARAVPVRGAYKAQMKGLRGGKLQTWSGRDVFTFQSIDTMFDIEYAIGRVHLGDEWVHQQLEEAGLQIDYEKAVRGTVDLQSLNEDTWEVVVNLAEEKFDDAETNFLLELNKMLWRSSTSDSKAFVGIDGVLSLINTTGPIGNRSRTNPLLRHQVSTSVNTNDMELKLNQLVRAANKRCRDGTMLNYATCGETFYDAIVEKMFTGSNAITVPNTRLVRNLDMAKSQAQAEAAKMGICFPDNAIYVAGVGILVIEPVFEDLDKEDAPATPWAKRCYLFNLDHLDFKPTKNKDGAKIIHPTPYNQRITRMSVHGEYACVADQLDCHAVMALA